MVTLNMWVDPTGGPADFERLAKCKPAKAKNPEKLKVLRGSADSFGSLREQLMGAEGLEPPTPSV